MSQTIEYKVVTLIVGFRWNRNCRAVASVMVAVLRKYLLFSAELSYSVLVSVGATRFLICMLVCVFMHLHRRLGVHVQAVQQGSQWAEDHV